MRKNPAQRGTCGQYNYRNVPFTAYYTPLRHVWCYDIRAVRDVYPLADAGVLRCESTSCAAAVLSARLHIDRLISTIGGKIVVGAHVSVPYDSLFVELRTSHGEEVAVGSKKIAGSIVKETPKFVVIEFRPSGGKRLGHLLYAVVDRRYFERHAKEEGRAEVGEPSLENPLPDVVRAGMLILSMVFVGTGVYFIAKAVDPLMPQPKEQYPIFGQEPQIYYT